MARATGLMDEKGTSPGGAEDFPLVVACTPPPPLPGLITIGIYPAVSAYAEAPARQMRLPANFRACLRHLPSEWLDEVNLALRFKEGWFSNRRIDR